MSIALLEHESRASLEAYGIPNVPGRFCRTVEEVVEAAAEIGYPVVLKVVSRQIVHKSEAGGVKVNLKDKAGVMKAFDEIVQSAEAYAPDAVIEGMLVTKFIQGAKEVIIGALQDAQFGPVIMVGLGGIFVEVFKDLCFGIAPVTKPEAEEMLMSLKSYPVLAGTRGEQPVHMEKLVQLLVDVSRYAYGENIQELDLNPVFCTTEGVWAGDARILLSKDGERGM